MAFFIGRVYWYSNSVGRLFKKGTSSVRWFIFFTFIFEDWRRRRRNSAPTGAHHQYWNVCGLKKSPRAAEKERTPPDCSGLVSKGGAQPSFQTSDYTQGTTTIEGLRQASSHSKRKEKNLQNHSLSDLPPTLQPVAHTPSFSLIFSHHIPLPSATASPR